MKKILLLITVLFLISCIVRQNLSISSKLHEGMSKSEVENLMGLPVKTDFYKNIEEWHYCKTGMMSDEFIALFFYEGKLIAKLNYTVTIADTKGVGGSCEKFIKMGTYREPDNVMEIRIR